MEYGWEYIVFETFKTRVRSPVSFERLNNVLTNCVIHVYCVASDTQLGMYISLLHFELEHSKLNATFVVDRIHRKYQ